MADGVQIGRVEDVLFDTTALRVAALTLTTTGGRSVLPFAAVRSLGADAVTVESATATQAAADQTGAGNLLRSLADLIGLKVVNGEGAYLGDVRDVTIEQASGALTELEAHSGGMLGLGGTGVTIPASAIRGLDRSWSRSTCRRQRARRTAFRKQRRQCLNNLCTSRVPL